MWPIGWGLDPLVAVALGAGAVTVCGLILYGFGPTLLGAVSDGWPAVIVGVVLALPCAAVILGVAQVVMAWRVLRSTIDVRGPILRLRAFGDEEKRRYYMAVDDGAAGTIRAPRVSRTQYLGLEQGELVDVRLTKNLGCVRTIASATPGPP